MRRSGAVRALQPPRGPRPGVLQDGAPGRAARGHRQGGRIAIGDAVAEDRLAELIEVPSGLEGVIAFDTAIAEPDKAGTRCATAAWTSRSWSGRVPFEEVWGLLVDGSYEPACRRPSCTRSRCAPATRAPTSRRPRDAGARVGLRQLIDIRRRAGARRPGARVGDGASPSSPSPPAASGGGPSRRREIDRRLDPRALPDPLARRGRPPAREGDRRLLDLGRRARHERIDFTARVVASTGADVAAGCRRASARCRGRCTAARLARAPDARRGRGRGRRRALGQAHARLRRPADGLRPPRLPRRGPARPRAAAHRARRSGRRGSRSRRSWSRPRWPSSRRASPIACWHQRGVLVGGGARLRERAAGAVHADVLVRASPAGRPTSSSRSARRLIRPTAATSGGGPRAADSVNGAAPG